MTRIHVHGAIAVEQRQATRCAFCREHILCATIVRRYADIDEAPLHLNRNKRPVAHYALEIVTFEGKRLGLCGKRITLNEVNASIYPSIRTGGLLAKFANLALLSDVERAVAIKISHAFDRDGSSCARMICQSRLHSAEIHVEPSIAV